LLFVNHCLLGHIKVTTSFSGLFEAMKVFTLLKVATLSVIGVGMRRSWGEESTTAPYDTDSVGGPRYNEDSVIL